MSTPMTLDEYQDVATSTAIYPGRNSFQGLTYCGLKLGGEAGEVSENIGKAIRDDAGKLTGDRRDKLIKELGDVLWYVSQAAHELDVTLSHVAATNLQKLADRKERGTLQGSGDDR